MHTSTNGFVAECFHAGLEPQLKRRIIDDFVNGRIQVICATNAFGMGIFLGTIHAAKGMEFPHVFIPGGDWKFSPQRSKQEEERRLVYVGMTRAMQTLCLLDCHSAPNYFLQPLKGEFLFSRPAPKPEAVDTALLHKRYVVLGMKQIYLDYAGTFSDTQPIHQHLSNIQTGDSVSLVRTASGIRIHDAAGFCIARLSGTASRFWGDKLDTILQVRVLALIQRHAKDPADEFRERIKAEHWELPLLEVVYGDDSD